MRARAVMPRLRRATRGVRCAQRVAAWALPLSHCFTCSAVQWAAQSGLRMDALCRPVALEQIWVAGAQRADSGGCWLLRRRRRAPQGQHSRACPGQRVGTRRAAKACRPPRRRASALRQRRSGRARACRLRLSYRHGARCAAATPVLCYWGCPPVQDLKHSEGRGQPDDMAVHAVRLPEDGGPSR